MSTLAEYVDGLPNIAGHEDTIQGVVDAARGRPVYLGESTIDFARVPSAAAVALHMHQPLIPAGGEHLPTAAMISNLQFMMEHQNLGDNHNAPVFAWCYKRMGELIPQLVAEGREPRVMLEYSGTLLHGLRAMGRDDVIDALRILTEDPAYRKRVEWLGAPWGHAVAPSTPVQDYRLHVRAWQQHFAAIFGTEALARVRGFSLAEMALPNHPDVAYALVRTLVDAGYQWLLVQEHSVEEAGDGRPVRQPHLPHRLVCRSSAGETASILAVIKTQGSDTKLVGQMQPWYEARSLGRVELGKTTVPPLVTQIADGENGGVMMNEFPRKYLEVVGEAGSTDTPLMNVTEYLEHLFAAGVREDDLGALQPVHQARIWARCAPGDGAGRVAEVIADLRREDDRFHMDGGSWTNDISWVRGYENVLGPMEALSARFSQVALAPGVSRDSHAFRNALFHLLTSQTSCYRYWGQGQWTDYGREICRRGQEILDHDF